MPLYTDIAAELYAPQCGTVPRGVRVHTATASDIRLTRVDISRRGLRRARGRYITLDFPHFTHIDPQDETYVHAIASQLRALLPAQGAVLVAGIGNRSVTADALGPATADRVFVTDAAAQSTAPSLSLRPVAAFSPGAAGATGMETAALLRAAVEASGCCAVVAVDSLCTATAARLGCSVQLSDAGLSPRRAADVTADTVGVPVIALGVPTVMELAHTDCDGAPLLVTPKDIDAIITRASTLLSLAVNKALQPALRVEELNFLTS